MEGCKKTHHFVLLSESAWFTEWFQVIKQGEMVSFIHSVSLKIFSVEFKDIEDLVRYIQQLYLWLLAHILWY